MRYILGYILFLGPMTAVAGILLYCMIKAMGIIATSVIVCLPVCVVVCIWFGYYLLTED